RNRSGALNFDEVVKGWNEIKAYKRIFEQFDKDGTASVDTYELSKVFRALDFTVNRQVLTAIVRRYGNRNNKIRLTDFLIVIFKLTLMFELFKEQQLKTGGDNDAASFTLNEYLDYTMYC
ncbi:calpain, small subunit 1, partial [Mytilus galloprovincialis]